MPLDPIRTEFFHCLLAAVAEEMGATLERAAFSPNIKERRDLSCAVFSNFGRSGVPAPRLVAQAAHIPVHLGALPHLLETLAPRFDWRPGDRLLTNDPYLGGTHLPDLTMLAPVFAPEESAQPFAWVVSRAHHADVGGMAPGSMPPSTELVQEGIVIPPVFLARDGETNEDLLALLLRNVRTPEERRGDLAAQRASLEVGERRLHALLAEHGPEVLRGAAQANIERSEAALRTVLAELPDGDYAFEDVLDDDGHGAVDLSIRVSLSLRGDRAHFDWSGTAPQTRGPVNATLAITTSAVAYALLCLLPEEVPATHGLFLPWTMNAPAGTLVNAVSPAAVAGGNVETSQRLVDVLFGALAQVAPERIPAAGQGTMNNIAVGGIDPRTGRAFAYYETLGGGMGGSPQGPGASGVHVHMSNTRITPVEALEHAHPVRVCRYALARGTGGAGEHPGGDGVIREIEFLTDVELSLLTERRARGPWGLAGGHAGAPGRQTLTIDGVTRELPAKGTVRAPAGSILTLQSPGGGGWGTPPGAEPVPASPPEPDVC